MQKTDLETNRIQTLLKEWNFLNWLLTKIREPSNQKIALQVRAGTPYLAARLLLAGHSLVLLDKEEEAIEFAEDASTFLQLFEQRNCICNFLPENSLPQRAVLLEGLLTQSSFILATTPETLKMKTFTREQFMKLRTVLKVGKVYPYAKLGMHLCESGYRRTEFVEERGEFALRGAVVDFWSPQTERPIRLVFKEDTIESMHYFELVSQRTIQFVPETILIPISQKNFNGTLLDFLPQQTIFMVRATEEGESLPFFGKQLVISITGEDSGLNPSIIFSHHWEFFKEELLRNQNLQINNFIFCRNVLERQRLEELLDELHIQPIQPEIVVEPLNRGFKSDELKFALWNFSEITGTPKKMGRLPKFKIGRTLDSLSEIQPGDYVVHERFGIGRYRGLKRMSWNPQKRKRTKESDFLTIEYKGGDLLYVPLSDFRLVQKYIGAQAKKPKLNSLDTVQWERLKQRVRAQVYELAKELLETAACRQLLRKPLLENQEDWKRALYEEFVSAFPYEETPDQIQAIRDVEKDLASPHLMDRLICGDVGYGKTEIALRAAFLAALHSKQVALLVPTTILAEQHFKTFSERCASFPLKVAMLSRFQKPKEQKKILEELKNGTVDILIGTHRIIQKDVKFKNLGLIIIDEEHRFGVRQKEFLKKMKLTADYLSLSATPIPRTLSQALGGIRDISVIETPPEGRLPIQTIVGPYNEELLKEAVTKELARGGQIFYVHNRIATLPLKKRTLEKLFPNLRIGLAHGRMSADALEKAMWNFLKGKWDLLLSTSIIESGLDIPSVNTLIVEDSEEFGLAQLYQLRGRIGRKQEKATCLLFFSDWHSLSDEARKRLEAIQEFSALGSGLKLAVRDLEIRGAGNLLGEEQHGWISAVGLELYCQLLSQEMKKLRQSKGVQISAEREEPEIKIPEVELEVSAFIPEDYVSSESERIFLYKKMSQCKSKDEIEKLQAELLDRFGPIPPPLATLFQILFLRMEAAENKIHSILETESGIIFSWLYEGKELPVNVGEFAKDFPHLIELLPSKEDSREPPLLKILFKKEMKTIEDPLEEVQKLLRIAAKYVKVINYG